MAPTKHIGVKRAIKHEMDEVWETHPMNNPMFLQRLNHLSREVEKLKREWLLSEERRVITPRPSLYGSVRGDDVTEGMIEDAKKSLFRDLEDL
jgi:hypothetical protein